MARGWESKEIESQMEDHSERQNRRSPERSPQEIAIETERDSLQLSRTRVLQDLAAASNPKYRELLERSLSFLDGKLAELDR